MERVAAAVKVFAGTAVNAEDAHVPVTINSSCTIAFTCRMN